MVGEDYSLNSLLGWLGLFLTRKFMKEIKNYEYDVTILPTG
jgi:hypothetical protein